jgi:rhodanese-related sulfurtransferase
MPNFITAEEMLASARSVIVRLAPHEALTEMQAGAVLIDIRSAEHRDRDGFLPGAHVIPRNVLEWRLDPRGEHRDPRVAKLDRLVIVICDEGYQSSLAAAGLQRFGLDATDVIGGVQSWRREGLKLCQAVETGIRRPGRAVIGGSVGSKQSHAGFNCFDPGWIDSHKEALSDYEAGRISRESPSL